MQPKIIWRKITGFLISCYSWSFEQSAVKVSWPPGSIGVLLFGAPSHWSPQGQGPPAWCFCGLALAPQLPFAQISDLIHTHAISQECPGSGRGKRKVVYVYISISISISISMSISRDVYIQWVVYIQPTPVLLPGKSHRWRSLVGCSPWGR